MMRVRYITDVCVFVLEMMIVLTITLRSITDLERGGDAFLAVQFQFGGLLAAYHGKLNQKEFLILNSRNSMEK